MAVAPDPRDPEERPLSSRPLTGEEREYLALLKAGLDQAVQGALITLGLAALPLGFFVSAWKPGRGLGGEQVALILALVILSALTWGVIAYSGKGARGRKLRRGDLRLRLRLAEDLAERAAELVAGEVEAKADETIKPFWQRKAERGAPRRFWLVVRGRRFEVTASRWLATAVGQPIALEHAARSGVVLVIDGVRDRLPLGDLPRGDDEDALGIPFKPG